MTPVFEGVLSYWSPLGGPGIRLLLRADHAASRLYVLPERDGRWIRDEASFRLDPLLLSLGQRSTNLNGQALIYGQAQMRSDPAFAAFLESMTPGHLTPGFATFPRFEFNVPGTSLMRNVGGWNDFSFPRVAGGPIDLSSADLSGLKFSRVDFRETTLSGTDFSTTEFDECRFGRQQLSRGRLAGARFIGQQLHDLDLSHAALAGASLAGSRLSDCNLAGANCADLQVEQTTFTQCDCNGTQFAGSSGRALAFVRCYLADARFDGARLEGCSFAGSTLSNTSFRQTELANATFTGAAAPAVIDNVDFDAADLRGADFTGTDLVGKVRRTRAPRFGASESERTRLVRARFPLSFLGSDCSYVDASSATIVYDVDPVRGIEDFKARHARLPPMEFAGFSLIEADFSGADLRGSRFGNADLADADFSTAMLDSTDFSGARLDEATFADATLSSANFTSAWLLQAAFDNTVLDRTNFSSAMLAAANFSKLHGLTAAGVNFSNACLAQAEFIGVTFTPSAGQQTSFAGACLAGADFSAARLTDAVLTNAQIAAQPGELQVNVHGHAPLLIEYRATRLEPGATGPQTICPDGGSGPCSLPRLQFRPVRPVWPS